MARRYQQSSTVFIKNIEEWEEEGITPLPEVITRGTCTSYFGLTEAAKSIYFNLCITSH